MKALRICMRGAGLLLALLVLLVGAAVVVAVLVDANAYKPKITKLIAEHTGRELTWHGDLELTFFPWLGVKTGPVELSNAAGFDATPMLAVNEAVIRIKVLPLLKSRVEVDTVRLNEPRIRLSRRADGVANWDDLAAKAGGGDGDGYSGENRSPPDAALLAGLAVQGISIQDGLVIWDDRAADQSLTLSALKLDTGKLTPGKPITVSLSAEAEGSVMPEHATITLVTTAQLAENLESVFLNNTEIGIATQRLSTDFSIEKISYALRSGRMAIDELRGVARRRGLATNLDIPSLRFNWLDGSLQLPQLDVQQDDFFLSGSAHGSEVMSGVSRAVSGDINARIGDLKGLLKRNQFPGETLPGLINSLVNSLDIGFQFALSNRNLVLSDLTVASLEEPDGKLLVNQKRVVIPLAANGAPTYTRVLASLLQADAEKKLNQWLLKSIAPLDDAGETEAAEIDLREALKEKLKKGLRNIFKNE